MSGDYQRHGELIDKMFLFGLTPEESEELQQIRDRIDDLEEIWYAPIIRKFEKLYPLVTDDPARGPHVEPRGETEA